MLQTRSAIQFGSLNIHLHEIDTATAGRTNHLLRFLSMKHDKRFNISICPNSDTANFLEDVDLCARMCNWCERWSTRSGLEMDFALEQDAQFNAIKRALMKFARRQTRTDVGIGSIGKH
jgi:hypothetical protein